MKPTASWLAAILLSTVLSSSIEGQPPRNRQTLQPKTAQNQFYAAASDDVAYLTSTETTSLNLPFSEAVRVGNILYLSGVIGNIPGAKKLVPGGIKAETQQTMENIKRILEKNGSSLDRIVKCEVMLADIKEWNAMNEVYRTYFSKDRFPARSAMGANGLALNARVEMDCVATGK